MTTRMRLRRADGQVYLDRWGIETERFGIYLHRMEAADPGIDLHSHPWWFASWVLWGGYDEERTRCDLAVGVAKTAERGIYTRRGTLRRRRWLSVASTPLSYCHRITRLHRSPTWTLVVRGKRVRRWGFYLPTGFMDWEVYDRTVRAGRRDLWAEVGHE